MRRSARRWAPPIAMLLALLSGGCQKEGGPNAPGRRMAALAINAQVTGASGAQVRVQVYYLRVASGDTTPVSLFDQTFPLPSGTTAIPVAVDVGACAADQARTPAGPDCVASVELSLVQNSQVLDQRLLSGLTLVPDQVTTLPSVVLSPVAKLTVAPVAATLAIGDTLTLKATATNSLGNTLGDRVFTWTSSAPATASVSTAGLVTAVAASAQPAVITVATGPLTATTQVTVTPRAAIRLTPASVTFAASSGGAIPAAQRVTITNSGGGSLTGLAVGAVAYHGATTGWLQATLSGTTVTLAILRSDLAPGADTATVPVTSPVAGNSPQAITVVYQIGQGPIISVAPPSATFAGVAGGANPAAQSVAVTNTGGGALTGLSVATAYGAGQATGWLTASLSSTSAPSTLTLAPNIAALPSRYDTLTATVTLRSTVPGVLAQAVVVTLHMAPKPAIVLSTTTVTAGATQGGPAPAAQTVTITNGGGGSLTGLALGTTTYAPAGIPAWLQATLTGTTVTLTVVQTDLAVGQYHASVPVTSPVASNSPQVIAVTLTIGQGPIISAAPPSLTFSAVAGGANPAALQSAITNAGGGALTGLSTSIAYGAGQPTGWITATLSAAAAPATLTVQPNIASLPSAYDTLTATITVASTVPGVIAQPVLVTLHLAPRPAIALAPATLTFNAVAGGTNPTAQNVTVTNSGGGTLSGLSTAITYGPGGPTGWLAAALSGATAPTQVVVQPNVTGLPAGTYTATVTVASTIPGVTAVSTGITLVVAAPPKIVLTPAKTPFNFVENGPLLTFQTVMISNGGGGTLAPVALQGVVFSAGSGGVKWLNVSVGGNSMTLTPASTRLAPGQDTAFITLTSAGASNSPYVDTVTVTVSPGPVMGINPATMAFTATQGGADPTPVVDTVFNSGTQTLDGLSIATVYAAGGPTGWLNTALNRTQAPAFVTVAPTVASLGAGTYSASVIVSSTLPAVGPDTIKVTLTVTVASAIVLTPDTLTFDVTENGPNPTPQTVTVSHAGGGSLGTVSLGSPGFTNSSSIYQPPTTAWLSPPTLSGNTVTIAPAITGLAVATHVVTIPVLASGASNSPQAIVVIVHVTTNWTSIATGLNHTCAIDSNSFLYCWGDNSHGQLGINYGAFTGGFGNPLKVEGGAAQWLSVYAAGNHTCAIDIQNKLWCWGQNDKGEVGNGSYTDQPTPVAPQYSDLATNTTAVALGTDFTCAVEGANKTLNCWGNNDHQQVGSSGITVNTPFPATSAPVNFGQLQAGDAHVCGISAASTTMWCWGANNLGQLGDSATGADVPVVNATAVVAPLNVPVTVAVGSGGNHSCVIGSGSASVPWCWGADAAGQLGNGTTTTAQPIPAPVDTAAASSLSSVAMLATGSTHSCAVLGAYTPGQTFCWGSNAHGELGIGTFSPNSVLAVQVVPSGASGFRAISAGGNFTCSIGNDDLARCWGDATDGKLGLAAGPTWSNMSTPTPILGQLGHPVPAPRLVRPLPGIAPARAVPTRVSPVRQPPAAPIRRPSAAARTAH